MNNHALPVKSFRSARWMFFPLLLLLFSGCRKQEETDTARSGRMVISVDRQLQEIAGIEADMFSRYYADAHLEIAPSAPAGTLGRLLDKSARAALISGDFDAAEDSLFLGMKKQLRKEPVAFDAIICITGAHNGRAHLSVKDIGDLFYGNSKGVQAFVLKDDYRLISVFSARTGRKKTGMRAWSCSSIDDLLQRVSSSDNSYALLFRSSLESAREAGSDTKNVKILPVSENVADAVPILPERDAVFENRYPLVATVYYVYYPGDALATGFGSWISSSGQKAMERSSYVPYRLTQRTIILK